MGEFDIVGKADGNPGDAKVTFVKQYIGRHKVFYSGHCTNGTL